MRGVDKGIVFEKNEDNAVRIKSYDAHGVASPLISADELSLNVGDTVAFVVFDDATGVILKKM
jgi:hypothetical protein